MLITLLPPHERKENLGTKLNSTVLVKAMTAITELELYSFVCRGRTVPPSVLICQYFY